MKILMLDIESAPINAYVWGLFDERINTDQIIDTSSVLCYAAKWYGKREVLFDSVQKSGKAKMLKSVHDLMSEADIVVTYNGERYDIPVLNREFLIAKMPPPAPYKSVDLFRTVRRKFRFASNKMDHVNDMLGLPKKIRHRGFKLWVDCMNGDEKAWREMERYNRRDVTALEAQYKRVLPWISNHPNVAMYQQRPEACTRCGSTHMQYRGTQLSKSQLYRRYQCQSCGGWDHEATGTLDAKTRAKIRRPI